MEMTSKERILAALKRQEPDRVPFCELAIDRALAERLMGGPPPRRRREPARGTPTPSEEIRLWPPSWAATASGTFAGAGLRPSRVGRKAGPSWEE
jgi:hypothetical protein